MTKRMMMVGCSLITTIVILTYLTMMLVAQRLISPAEYFLYTNAIARATMGHIGEDGGRRALVYTSRALTHPVGVAPISTRQGLLTFPLPPHTIHDPALPTGQGNHYLSFATDADLIQYITITMPHAGWTHTDQMGAGHFFTDGHQQVVLSQRYFLSTAIRELVITAYP